MERFERIINGLSVHYVFDDFGHEGMDYEGYEVIDTTRNNRLVGFIPYEMIGDKEKFKNMDEAELEELVMDSLNPFWGIDHILHFTDYGL
jgi:hypothetical protein